MNNQLIYTLQMADDAVILGQRLGEWCGHGPVLEQDIALTNMALDHIGRARSLYHYAADLYNRLPAAERKACFASVALDNKIAAGQKAEEDDMAFLRDAWDFRNHLLVELPNKDWAYTVARCFFTDVFNYYFFSGLVASSDTNWAAIAEKSLKEVAYHLKWSSEWMIRLGDGTEESHAKIQQAVNDLWTYTGELLTPNAVDAAMAHEGMGPDLNLVQQQWLLKVTDILTEATLQMPTGKYMQSGGKEGRHTEHLGFILAEMQYMQRAYPNMAW